MDIATSALLTYKVSEKNSELYKKLCKDLLKSPSVFLHACSSVEYSGSLLNSFSKSVSGTSNDKELKNKKVLSSEDENFAQNKRILSSVDETQTSKFTKSNISKLTKNKRKLSSDNENADKIKRIRTSDLAVPVKNKRELSENVIADLGNAPDIKSLQKNFIISLNNSSTLDIKMYKSVEPYLVCSSAASDLLVISDEILIQACKKSEKLDDGTASVLGTLLVLPKIYHLTSKLPPSSCDAICNYIRWHPKITVINTLVPFFKYCLATQEQHRDLLVQLIEHIPSSLLPVLLSAISSRKSIGDVDFQIFQQLCLNVDSESENTHMAVLLFLDTALKTHNSSVKFGQCLLFIVKQMGHYIQDLKTLQGIVDSHSSGMKKAIEIQLKKILKMK